MHPTLTAITHWWVDRVLDLTDSLFTHHTTRAYRAGYDAACADAVRMYDFLDSTDVVA